MNAGARMAKDGNQASMLSDEHVLAIMSAILQSAHMIAAATRGVDSSLKAAESVSTEAYARRLLLCLRSHIRANSDDEVIEAFMSGETPED